MSDYTPSTGRVEDRYRHARRLEGGGDKGRAEFNRWLVEHDADHEKAVRERIARDIEALRAPITVHIDYPDVSWENAQKRAARIAREGA